MPGVARYSVDLLLKMVAPLVEKGLRAVLIFGVVGEKEKDEEGSCAGGRGRECCVHAAVRQLKKQFGELLVICDVCLCAYTTHGHCGILDKDGYLDNDKSAVRLSEVALSYADAGADMVAPSDMMDGRVREIRKALGQRNVSVMSYSAKFCSGLYGPFRDVCQSAPQKFDRSSYQLPPGSRELALRAVRRDIQQGADYIMVKPISAYLDVVRDIKNQHPDVTLACYHVSGEYSMICLAAHHNLIDKKRVVLEYFESFVRAGCDIIISYFTPEVLDWL